MKDPYDIMSEPVTALAFVMLLLIVLVLSACTPTATVKHEIPLADKIVDTITAMPPPVPCRKLDLPPVPADVVLDIKGDNITANAGGETVLRGYVACRSLYRAAP